VLAAAATVVALSAQPLHRAHPKRDVIVWICPFPPPGAKQHTYSKYSGVCIPEVWRRW
jgi:hypothetical protein